MLYEVEVRNILKPQGYRKLDNYLKKHARLIEQKQEETICFRVKKGDLLLRRNDSEVKLTYKDRDVIQDIRAEMEILMGLNDFDAIQEILQALKFTIKMKWYKRRKIYRWQGVIIALDNVKGQGLSMEMEKLVDGRLKKKAQIELQVRMIKLLNELNIKIYPKKDLTAMMQYYHQHWTKSIKKNWIKI
ncbi:MAG: CYTH domain-containing protein [Candidatus Komeilibacteria bacterium]